jgi:hypothetical protein
MGTCHPHTNLGLWLDHADMDAMLKLAAAKGIAPMLELMPIHKVSYVIEKGWSTSW